MRFPTLLLLLSCLIRFHTKAQGIPAIGTWTDHLSYNQATHVVESNGRIYTSTPNAIFSTDPNDQSIERRSKLTGLSGTGISTIASNGASLVIAYNDGNIDILKDGKVININAIRNNQALPSKSIYEIVIDADQAFLCTAFGIVVINLDKSEIAGTYTIGNNGIQVPVFSLCRQGNSWYAASTEGLKRGATTGTNLEDYRSWQSVTTESLTPRKNTFQLLANANQLFYRRQDSIFILITDTTQLFYTSPGTINAAKIVNSQLVTLESQTTAGVVNFLNANGTIGSTLADKSIVAPFDIIESSDEFFIADSARGLIKHSQSGYLVLNPSSPGSDNLTALVFGSGLLAAAFIPPGISLLQDREWINFDSGSTTELKGNKSIADLAFNPMTGDLWAGSINDGMLQRTTNGVVTKYKEGSFLSPSILVPSDYTVSGIAFDHDANMWICNSGAIDNLLVQTKDQTTIKFRVPFNLPSNSLGKMLVDDINQKWIIAPDHGLICFNSGADIRNPSDDQWKQFSSGPGNGNLPTDEVLSIAKDKNNFIWVGTSSGIGIIQCTEFVFSNSVCEAILPVVQQGNFNGYLFRGESVQAIAIDGADRKWVGTKNGAWLISPDGQKTIEHFTADNSPLPANDIRSIAIDPSTGEVYISTSTGLCSYRGTATESAGKANKVLVFPNPVPPGYSGTIGITGVPSNSIVKITELNGRLVYQGKSNGGMLTWNGLDSRGQRVSTGVYLVLMTDLQRTQSLATKIIFISK